MKRAACMLNPAGWDLDPVRDLPDEARHQRAAEAVAACYACPFLDGCRWEAEQHSPRHACVWGGLVYDGSGRPGMALGEWVEAQAAARTRIGQATTCPVCGVEVAVTTPGRRYCSPGHAKQAENARRRAARSVPDRDRVHEPEAARVEQVRPLLDCGLGAKQIAERLGVSRRSVHRYQRALLRTQAAPQVRRDQLAVL